MFADVQCNGILLFALPAMRMPLNSKRPNFACTLTKPDVCLYRPYIAPSNQLRKTESVCTRAGCFIWSNVNESDKRKNASVLSSFKILPSLSIIANTKLAVVGTPARNGSTVGSSVPVVTERCPRKRKKRCCVGGS